jgi:preprotein translocase subunit SecD
MKFFNRLLIGIVIIAILWIDTPSKFKVFNKQFSLPVIDFKIFNKEIKKEFKIKLGLDLKGGSRLVFLADASKLKTSDINDALESTRNIIEKRVNFFGVSEPSVQTLKTGSKYKIIVELPGITNIDEAVSKIGKTAQLSFKEELSIKTTATTSGLLSFKKESVLTGQDVKKAEVVFDPKTGNPQVQLNFTKSGVEKFAVITKKNIGKRVGIFIDEYLISAPVVQQAILEGNAVITGNFTTKEAKSLAQDINGGALPLSIKLIEQRNIGPTLGLSEVRKSIFAGTVGLIAVLLFMFLYYGRFGLIADLALIIYGLISLAIFKLFSVVMTLSGVAGFILSIGMAVDSNILIFERIKEELRAKKDLGLAIKLGFGRAIDAIKDANFTTLIVSFILFNPLSWNFLPQFGLVRGFALTLIIGVATSLFTGVFITKRLINFFYKKSVAA